MSDFGYDRPVEADPEILRELWSKVDSLSSDALGRYARSLGVRPPSVPPNAYWDIGVAYPTDEEDGVLYWFGPDPSEFITDEWERFDTSVAAEPSVLADLRQVEHSMSARALARYAESTYGLRPPDGAPFARWEIVSVHQDDDPDSTDNGVLYWTRPYPDGPGGEGYGAETFQD